MFLKASPPEGRASESGGGCGEEKGYGEKESPQPPTRFRERSERHFQKSGIFDKISSSGVIKILHKTLFLPLTELLESAIMVEPLRKGF